MNTPLVQSPSKFSIKLGPQFTNGFISVRSLFLSFDQVLWGGQTCALRHASDDGNEDENSSGSSNECLAVVPWVPSQFPSAQGAGILGQTNISDMMEAEDDMEGVAMDVEDNGCSVGAEQRPRINAGAAGMNEGLHQWQQQHCMIPQHANSYCLVPMMDSLRAIFVAIRYHQALLRTLI